MQDADSAFDLGVHADEGLLPSGLPALLWLAGALAGIQASGLASVVQAFEKKPRPPVAWLHFQDRTCCSESFIRSAHPIVADIVLDLLSLNYTETLQAAGGFQAEKCLEETIRNFPGQYILLVEGSVPTADGGIYCTIGGRSAMQILEESAKDAAAVIAWGSCASNGCIQAANPNPTGATPIHKILSRPVINVPGCPPIAEVMTGVVAHYLIYGKLPELDGQGRPKEFYSRRVHHTCYRRPYYDAGLFESTADKVGLAVGVAAAAGVAAHAVTTNIRKQRTIGEHKSESVKDEPRKGGDR